MMAIYQAELQLLMLYQAQVSLEKSMSANCPDLFVLQSVFPRSDLPKSSNLSNLSLQQVQYFNRFYFLK